MKPHIIIPCATSRDRGAIAQLTQSPGGGACTWHVLTANYHSAQNRWATSVGAEVARVQHLRKALRQQTRAPIGMVATADFGAMVASIAAAVAIGPEGAVASLGMMPVMRCRHKYYQRQVTAPHLLVGPGLWLEEREPDAASLDYPVYAKLPLSSMGIGGQLIHSPKALAAYSGRAFETGRTMLQQLQGLPEAVLAELPLMTRNGFLTEVPMLMNQVTVMGRCINGAVIADTVVETVFHPDTRNVKCFRWPAQLPEDAMQAVQTVACTAVERLQFHHGMWNAEVWWQTAAGGPVAELIEVNPRPATYFYRLLQIGADYALYQGAADMALGGPGPAIGPPKRAGWVEQASITTAEAGVAEHLIDFKALERLEQQADVTVIYHFRPQDTIRQLSPYPVIVAERIGWV